MSYQSVKIAKMLPNFATIFVHALGIAFPLTYGIYHLLFDTVFIGSLCLVAAFSAICSLACILSKKDNGYFFHLYVISLGAAILLTSYYYGYRGLVFVFPYTASLFYLMGFRVALIGGIVISFLCLIAALNVVEYEVVLRYSAALLIAIGFSACYAYVMQEQRSSLEYDAHYDDLTGITNRRYFSSWLASLFNEEYKRFKNITLFYLDIDDFKYINDTYGHAAGDDLLKSFSERIINLVRQDDLITATSKIYNFARLAGDEFVLAIIDLDDVDTAKKIAKRLLEKTAISFYVGGEKLNINISVGVAFSEDKMSVDALLHNADVAMYRAKKSGKNTFYLYDESLLKEIVRRKDIEESITSALSNESFELVYMPIYDISEKQAISGFEVLLRCDENYLHLSELEQFISVAEASGLIKDIDHWVVENAFKKLVTIDEKSPLADIWCAINISSAELLDSKFIEKVKLLLTEYNIDPSRIHLEITETKLVPYENTIIKRLEKLKSLGFHLALDDYGTGYTGFSQLLNFPGNYIKIDRSFISEIGVQSNKYNKMIDIIMSIAKICQLQVIAEGVETKEQLDYLSALGCQYAQGYYFSKPLSWELLTEKLHDDLKNH
ncbi:MAG: putative bifunctional diguanylate cyclase/phosphodiesterase [Cellvibrionaceae bacterium]